MFDQYSCFSSLNILRLVALFLGKYWERTRKEIPCLNLIHITEPKTLAGRKVRETILVCFKAGKGIDLMRIQVAQNGMAVMLPKHTKIEVTKWQIIINE